MTPAKPATAPDLLVDAGIDDVPAASRTALPERPNSRPALAYLGICLVLIGHNRNVLLPGLVKRDFPHLLGLTGGLCTTAICASAVLGAGFTYPVSQATGSFTAAGVLFLGIGG